jgi:hypothetical protein
LSSTSLGSYLAPIVTNSNIFSDILNAENIEFNNLYNDIDDIELQFDINTATWGVDYYEKELNIITDYTKDLDYRRSVVKSKWRSDGKLDSDLIKRVCDSFSNGNVQVTYDGIIRVKFTSVVGTPPNMDDLKNAVEQIKPAFILLEYLYRYLLIKEIDSLMTINQLQSTLLNKFAGGA